MLLYLTSSAAKTLDGLVPFLPRTPREMTVAFVSTAAGLYEETPWLEEDRKKLLDMGFAMEDVDIKDKTAQELEKLLAGKDILFIAGGNTSYLLEQAQKSGFLELAKRLIREGMIYIGSSAGSMFAGPNIEVDKVFDEGEFGRILDSYDALGLVDFVVLPHADNPIHQPFIERAFREYGNMHNLRTLNDNQAIFVTNDGEHIIEA